MKKDLFLFFAFIALSTSAQVNNTEPSDPKPGPQVAWQRLALPTLGWGTTDVRYSRSQVPETTQKPPVLRAWRGERVSAQAVLATPVDLGNVTFEVSDLRCGKNVIPASAVKKYFVRYVLTETYGNRKDSFLMADRLDPVEQRAVNGVQLVKGREDGDREVDEDDAGDEKIVAPAQPILRRADLDNVGQTAAKRFHF